MRRLRWNQVQFPALSKKNSSFEWDSLKDRLTELLNQREKDKSDIIANLIQEQEEEMREEIQNQDNRIEQVRDAMKRFRDREKDESLFYELYAFSMGDISLTRARLAALVVAYKKQRQKKYHGKVSKKRKFGNFEYDTEKAILACEEYSLKEWSGRVDVNKYYFQSDRCFKVAFWFSLLDMNSMDSLPKHIVLDPISNDVMLEALRRTRKSKVFIRDHKDIYAGLLFDR